ncbi:hypothetical protein ACPJHQ_19415 [Rossellomorea sp. H39__3]
MKKNTWIILAAAIIFILLFAWLLSRESGVEKVLNHYTKEKYGFNVTIMSTKHEHPTIFIVKRTDQPEVVFLMEMEEKHSHPRSSMIIMVKPGSSWNSISGSRTPRKLQR